MSKIKLTRMLAILLFAASCTIVFSSSKEKDSFTEDSYLNSTTYARQLCINNGYSKIDVTYFGGSWAMLCNCDTKKGDPDIKCVEEVEPIE